MKIIAAIIVTLINWSVFAGDLEQLKQKANQQDAQAQFELALQYLSGLDVEKSTQQAQYWFELAAENANQDAQRELIKLLLSKPTAQDVEQALYWQAKLTLQGDNQERIKLARIYEKYASLLLTDSNALIWYQLASADSPQAEQKYSELLEARFNQRRLKQVAQIDQLNSAFEFEQNANIKAAATPSLSSDIITSDRVTIVAIILILSGLITRSIVRKRRQIRENHNQRNTVADLKKTIRNQQRNEERLRQQMSSLIKQYKKMQANQTPVSNSTNGQKLISACALFGCEPQTIPSVEILKQRYRQLSKIYHPDAGGTSASMSQLNYSFKLLVTASKIKK